MLRLTISCVGCGQTWSVTNTFSIYEQQAVESCPCPHCGAYTLCCRVPDGETRPASVRRIVLETALSAPR